MNHYLQKDNQDVAEPMFQGDFNKENVSEGMIPGDFNTGKNSNRVLVVRNTFLDVSFEDSWVIDTKATLRRQQTDSILDQKSRLRDELLAQCSWKLPLKIPECSWKKESTVESFIPDISEILNLSIPTPMNISEEAYDMSGQVREDSEHLDSSESFIPDISEILNLSIPTPMNINEEVYDMSGKVREDSEHLDSSESPEQSSQVGSEGLQAGSEMQAVHQVFANVGGVSGCTTVMMREVPSKYTQGKLLREIDSSGFAGQYDFIYLPMDSRSNANRGFAFINMVSEEAAEDFYKKFHGKHLRHFSANAEKTIIVLPADVQGFEENALKYASTMSQGKRTGHTKPVFLRPLPRHIEAKINASSKPSAPPTQQKNMAAATSAKQQKSTVVAHRSPQRPTQNPPTQNPNQDAQELLTAVLQQALLPLIQASLSTNLAPQQAQACFCSYCGKKRLPKHMFCGHCGGQFD
jgi:RNA recognition motif-containing protein